MAKPIILLGAGGHAKVIADIAVRSGRTVLGFLDDKALGLVLGLPVLGKINAVYRYADKAEFVIAIGDNAIRLSLENTHKLTWTSVVHPSAQVALGANIGIGSVLMANAVVNANATVGQHCIINTASVIEHDCLIGDFVHVSPGAILCGTAHIGRLTHIGAGAVVKNNIAVCGRVVVGAGAVVVKNIDKEGTYMGVPARCING